MPSEETENVSPTEVTPKWAKGLRTLGGFFVSVGGRLDKTGAPPHRSSARIESPAERCCETCSRSSREQSVADQRCSDCGRCELCQRGRRMFCPYLKGYGEAGGEPARVWCLLAVVARPISLGFASNS